MIIGIAGKKGSGKDMLGNYLIQKYGFKRYAFGDPVKEVCRNLFGFNDDQLYGNKKEQITELGITPREAFQKIGTDFGRKALHQLFPSLNINDGELWIYLFHVFMEKNIGENGKHKRNYVITDVRFKNEADAIRSQGGFVILLDSIYSNKEDTHESENIDVDYDYVLPNYGTKTQVFMKLDNLICIHKQNNN